MLYGIIAILIAFALGSIPTAYVLGRVARGTDIREVGSGNPGAMNAAAQIGKLFGLVVLLVDAGKGVLAVIVAQWLDVSDVWIYGVALAATLGHNFTPLLRFRGGKGAATILGISAYMLWRITLISALVGLVALVVSRRPVISLAVIFFALNALTIYTDQPTGQIALCLALSFLVAGTHLVRQYNEIAATARDRKWREFIKAIGSA